MFTIKSLKLKVIGFWDQCFFRQNSKYSGLICLDESGNEKLYSYFELRQMMKRQVYNVVIADSQKSQYDRICDEASRIILNC